MSAAKKSREREATMRAVKYIQSNLGRMEILRGLREIFIPRFFAALRERLEELSPEGWKVVLRSVEVDPYFLSPVKYVPGDIEIVKMITNTPGILAGVRFKVQSQHSDIDVYLTFGGEVIVHLIDEDDKHNVVEILAIDKAVIQFNVGEESVETSHLSAAVLAHLGGYTFSFDYGRFNAYVDKDAVDAISNMIVRIVSHWDKGIVLKNWAGAFFAAFSSWLHRFLHTPWEFSYLARNYMVELSELTEPTFFDKDSVRVEIMDAEENCLAFRFTLTEPFAGTLEVVFPSSSGQESNRTEGEERKEVSFHLNALLSLQIKPNLLQVGCRVELFTPRSVPKKIHEILYEESVHHLDEVDLPRWESDDMRGKLWKLVKDVMFHLSLME